MYTKTVKAVFISATLLASSVVMPASALNIVQEQHLDMFLDAVDNDKKTDQTLEIWKNYFDTHPDNSAIAGYYGSLLASRANHVWFPLTKTKLANEGLAVMDKMLTFVDDDKTTMGVADNTPAWFEAKILASTLFMRIPNIIFQRRDEGMKIAEEVINETGFDSIAPVMQAKILAHYARELAADNKISQAHSLAKQALNLGAEGEDADIARKALEAKNIGG